MFRGLYRTLRASKLAQAGVILVVLGGAAEALDQLGAVDLASVPYVGAYAPAILASAGIIKICLRLAMFLITGIGALNRPSDQEKP